MRAQVSGVGHIRVADGHASAMRAGVSGMAMWSSAAGRQPRRVDLGLGANRVKS